MRLGVDDDAELPLPAKHDLSSARAVGGGDLGEPGVAQQLAGAVRAAVEASADGLSLRGTSGELASLLYDVIDDAVAAGVG